MTGGHIICPHFYLSLRHRIPISLLSHVFLENGTLSKTVSRRHSEMHLWVVTQPPEKHLLPVACKAEANCTRRTCGLCMKGLPTSWLAQPQEPCQWSQEKIIEPLSQPYNRPYVTHVYTGTMTRVSVFFHLPGHFFKWSNRRSRHGPWV